MHINTKETRPPRAARRIRNCGRISGRARAGGMRAESPVLYYYAGALQAGPQLQRANWIPLIIPRAHKRRARGTGEFCWFTRRALDYCLKSARGYFFVVCCVCRVIVVLCGGKASVACNFPFGPVAGCFKCSAVIAPVVYRIIVWIYLRFATLVFSMEVGRNEWVVIFVTRNLLFYQLLIGLNG